MISVQKNNKVNPALRSPDEDIGCKIRVVRMFRKLTQKALADKISVSYQLIQKYEIGETRVSATRLADIAKALHVPITAFFDDCDQKQIQNTLKIDNPDEQDLMNAYRSIEDLALRKKVTEIIRSLGESE